MSIKLANKFLENNKYNEKVLRQYDRKSEEYELVPRIKNRRISSIFRVKERKVNQFTIDCITTMIIFYATFILGRIMCSNLIINKVFDQKIWSTHTSMKPTIFGTAFGLGSLLTSLSANLLGREISAALFLAIICVTQVFSSNSESFKYIITSVEGLSSGALFVTLIVWIIDIWRDKSRPLLQTIFFFISLATFLQQFIQKQQFIENQSNDSSICRTSSPIDFTEITSNYLINNSKNSNDPDQNILLITGQKSEQFLSNDNCLQTSLSNICEICFAFLSISGSAFFIILYDNNKEYLDNNRIRIRSKRFGKNPLLNKRFSIEKLKSWKSSFFIVLISLLLSSYLTIEFSNMKLLSIYLHSFDPQISDNKMSLIRIVFYGSQTVFGCLSILTMMLLKPEIILITNLFAITVANLTLILFSINSYAIILIVSVLMGYGFSSTCASILGIVEQYIHINDNMGAVVIFLSFILRTIVNHLSQHLIEEKNTLFFICLNFISVIIILFGLTLIWSSKYFINAESFNLKTHRIFKGKQFKFGNDHASNYKDSFGSDGNYQPRDTSIVSI